MATVSLLGVTLGSACGDEGGGLAPPEPSGGTTTNSSGPGGTCDEGAERDCSVTVAEHDGVLTCYHGTQHCVGGEWSACGDGTMRVRTAPKAPAEDENGLPRPLSLSMPADCIDNPCDPSCQVFEEDPGAGGVTIPPVLPPFPWSVGDINSLPPAIAQQGTNEPCSTAEDCQFDQYCQEGSAVGCAHHPCAEGNSNSPSASNAGLFEECSPCVQKVCDSNPSCCISTYPGPCEHDVCVAGSPLKASCDPCVAAICAARPGCCAYTCANDAECVTRIGAGSVCNFGGQCTTNSSNTCGAAANGYTNSSGVCIANWTNSGFGNCVSRVPMACAPKTCVQNKWTETCVAAAEAQCGTDCQAPPGTCEHHPCYTGDPLSTPTNCDPVVQSVCAAPGKSYCCSLSGRWDEDCVKEWENQSGGKCTPKGQCVAYLPTETNPHCATPDLTVGVPCGGIVPVCNRGGAAVPAGTTIDVSRYPAGTNSFPSTDPNDIASACNPAAGNGTTACSITLAQPLVGGECVNVTGCMGVVDGDEIRVNPPGPNHVAECQCGNNWSVYQSDPCGSPGCIANASVSFVKKLTMFIAVDRSTSMACSGAGCPSNLLSCPSGALVVDQRWNPMKNALNTFFQDPTSAGTDVALRFWPTNNPPSQPACGPTTCGLLGAANPCRTPLLFGTLTAANGAADPHETALVNALNTEIPCGDTPVHNAMDGALEWAKQHKTANPDQEVIVVFITDGIANQCNTDWLAISQLAQSAFYSHGVRTYPIGFGNAQESFVVQVAQYGGGRGFFMNTTGAAFQASLLAALKSIRGDVLPCDVQVPVAGLMDPSQVSVIYTNSMGVDTTLTRQNDPATCGTGWYFDPADPAIAKLCPATCALVQADTGARVQATVPCIDSFSPTTYSQTYQAECPAGAKVQWGFLRWDATTPSDTNVVFTARTADALVDLPMALSSTLGTAHAAPIDTQACTMTGPAPECPVDLYADLGGLPNARHDYLELTMTLNPSSDGQLAPTINNWEITYSCPFSE